MDAPAYPTGYRRAPRDRGSVPAGLRDRAPVTGQVGTAGAGKTGQRGDPDSGTAAAPVPAPEPEPAPGRSPTASACEPYREVIEIWLGQGRNAKAIWQDLVDDHGFRGAYQSVKRFVGKLRGSRPPEARVVIETPPGEDYGEFRVMVRSALPDGRFEHWTR